MKKIKTTIRSTARTTPSGGVRVKTTISCGGKRKNITKLFR